MDFVRKSYRAYGLMTGITLRNIPFVSYTVQHKNTIYGFVRNTS